MNIPKVLRTDIANTVGKGPLHWELITQAAFPKVSRRTRNLHIERRKLDFSSSHGSPPSISPSYFFILEPLPPPVAAGGKSQGEGGKPEQMEATDLGKVPGLHPALKVCLVNSWFFSFLLSPFMLNGS